MNIVPEGKMREDALKRIKTLDCANTDETQASCDPDAKPPSEVSDWQKKLKAAGVYDATYAEALATELRRLVCTGNADAIYIFRGLVDSCFWRVLQLRADGSPLLRELKREAPSLVDYITSENCPLAASLTNGEKEMLLAIKQAAAQDSAPPPASQKDK
jgi:hypothetical protein